MSNTTPRVWFITGSSTGFGRSLTQRVLAHGERVIATARQPERLQDLIDRYPRNAKAVRLDVTNPNEVKTAVDTARAVFGRIDVLVNNAGYGLVGALEEVSDAQIRRNFETNLFGAIRVMQAVLPLMREQKGGHIFNMSACAGFANEIGFSIYGSTKFALEGVSEALAGEVGPLGIKVTLVEPGPFRTDFAGRSLERAERTISAYNETSGKFRHFLAQGEGSEPGDPDKVADAMLQVVESNNPPLRLVCGKYAYNSFRQKLKSLATEFDAWEPTGINTDFEAVGEA